MGSTFGGLNIANSGLFISQRQLEVTSHNITNANVTGYSRQRYVTSAVDPKGYLMQFSPTTVGTVGGGVETLSLDQIRDKFLDQQYRTEQAKSTYWSTRSDSLYYVEDVFNSLDQGSLDGIMSQFFSSLQELSKNTTDEAVRTNVVSQAKKMCDTMRMYHTQLTDLMTQQNVNLGEQTKHTNEIIGKLATLNDKIHSFELGGNIANDLRDERNLLLDELSGMIDISYTEKSFEPPVFNIRGVELTAMTIYAGVGVGDEYSQNILVGPKDSSNQELKSLYEPRFLVYGEETGLNHIADENDPPIPTYGVYLASGVPLDSENIDGLEGGMLKSYKDMRDGNTTDVQGIPYYLDQLNVLVNSLVTEFNDIHSQGYTMPFSNPNATGSSVSGIDFFKADGLTAATMGLSEEILSSSFNIAASTELVTMDADGHQQTGNNVNILNIIKGIKERQDLDDVGSYEGFYKNYLGNLASEVSIAKGMEAAQEVLSVSINTQRTSIMGVSLDEEMTDMVKFQHAYNAAARSITTMDELLDKLINGTGRAGL